MNAHAVVVEEPHKLHVRELALTEPTNNDLVVDIHWSGISTGTEKLLWSGRMPMFPGMGYPLVPGYESVGRVAQHARTTASARPAWLYRRRARLAAGVAARRPGARSSVQSGKVFL